MPVTFEKEFFELQIRTAQRVCKLSGQSLETTLLQYTNFYVRLGFGRKYDENYSGWRSYIDGVRKAVDVVDWTHQFYLRDLEGNTAPQTVARFGCFAYSQGNGLYGCTFAAVAPSSTHLWAVRLSCCDVPN